MQTPTPFSVPAGGPLSRSLVPALALALACSSCVSQPGVTMQPSIRGSAALVESYEAEISDGTGSQAVDTEYSSVDVGFGVVSTDESGKKLGRAEVVLGGAEYGDLEALEISGGGRFYLGDPGQVSPFLSIYSVVTTLDSVLVSDGFTVYDVDPGVQLGLRLGGGVEYQINEVLFVDLAADYTLPLIAAEATVDGFSTPVETELYGLAIRVGVGVTF